MAKSEQTKRKILESAKTLFCERGYSNVTVREIAAAANISHTTIYLYYKDKAELLKEIALLPLLEFEQIIKSTVERYSDHPKQLIKEIGKQFIEFGILNRTMYDVYFNQGSVNVQETEPLLEINQIRNQLFEYITQTFAKLYPSQAHDEVLKYARMFYYFSNGLILSYLNNTEEPEVVLKRVQPLIEEMIEIQLLGIDQYTSRSHPM